MQWADVVNDPSLRNLPYKIELNERGQIVMSPASNRHRVLQSRIARLLGNCLTGGETITECAIATAHGVKVADVAWAPEAFLAQHGFETPYSAAPALCVEILSPSNSAQEMEEKRRLYFAGGAWEVWLVREDGAVQVFGPEGRRPVSQFGIPLDGIG